MINIEKVQHDPKSLQDFKNGTQQKGAGSSCNYSLLVNPEKNEYKRALLEEQHFLCAYCNRNLDEFATEDKLHHLKIEHWYPQALCPSEAHYNTPLGMDISHDNMLIVCPGKNVNPDFSHCDSSRTPLHVLTLKPQDPKYRFQNIFTYESGKLKTDIANIQRDVNDELHLNEDMLVKRRNIVLDTFIKELLKNKPDKQVMLAKYSTPNRENRLKEYCTIIIYFITNRVD